MNEITGNKTKLINCNLRQSRRFTDIEMLQFIETFI